MKVECGTHALRLICLQDEHQHSQREFCKVLVDRAESTIAQSRHLVMRHFLFALHIFLSLNEIDVTGKMFLLVLCTELVPISDKGLRWIKYSPICKGSV